jgi:hypothetical protein
MYWRTQEEGRKEDDMKRLLLLGGWAVAGRSWTWQERWLDYDGTHSAPVRRSRPWTG